MENSVKMRIPWIDWAKAVAIFCMVLCHAHLGESLAARLIRNAIYSFHMPMFFIVSGYLFKPRKPWQFIAPILPAILFCSVTSFFMRLLFSKFVWHSFGLMEVQEALSDGLVSFYRNSPFSVFRGAWFVFTLLFSQMLMSMPVLYKNRIAIAFACFVFIAWLGPTMPRWWTWHASKCFATFPFFVAGHELFKRGYFIGKMDMRVLCALFLIWLVVAIENGFADVSYGVFGHGYGIFAFCAALGSLMLFEICSHFRTNSVIRSISTGTLLILGMHTPIFYFVLPVFRRIFPHSELCKAVFSSIATFFICFGIIRFSERYCPALLGKRLYNNPNGAKT